MMIRCRDRGVDRDHHRPAAGVSRYQRLISMLVLLLPLLSHAEPLITPATPLPGKALAAPSDAAIKGDAQGAATAGEPGEVRAAEPSRAVKPASPRSPIKAPDTSASAATPGLYLSRVEDKNELRLRFRFAGLVPDVLAQAESRAQAAGQVRSHAKPHGHAHGNAQRATRQASATADTAQSSDPCLRTHSGTRVIRTGQASGPCSGAEFRARMSHQLKAAMAEIDAGASDAGSPVKAMSKSSAAARHISLTAPPFTMTLIARAPGEDNLRRLNSRSGWADQYQSRMAEIRMGQ